jgi:hypothetical protein
MKCKGHKPDSLIAETLGSNYALGMSRTHVLSVACILSITLFVATATAQQPAAASEIHQIFVEDQKDRGVGAGVNAKWDDVSRRDKVRRERVNQLLTAGNIKTGQDYEDAAFVFQHGDSPDDYLLAHVLAMAAMERGNTRAKWIAAATLDRYLQAIKQPQVFGTQYLRPNERTPFTQEPYNASVLSDQLRAEFCVPDREEQKSNAEALNKNAPLPESTRLPRECRGQ